MRMCMRLRVCEVDYVFDYVYKDKERERARERERESENRNNGSKALLLRNLSIHRKVQHPMTTAGALKRPGLAEHVKLKRGLRLKAIDPP